MINEKQIQINCSGSDYIPFRQLSDFQGDLKKLSDANLLKLERSIIKHGIIAPCFAWINNGERFLLDGHQRCKAYNSLYSKGYSIPDIPFIIVNASSIQDAKEKLLQISSQFGEFDIDELSSWMLDIDAKLEEDFRLLNKEINSSIEKLEEDTSGESSSGSKYCTCPQCGEEFEL